MANKDVYMDTRVFTDIVNRIGGTSSKCILSTDPLSKIDVFEETGDDWYEKYFKSSKKRLISWYKPQYEAHGDH